ncbi:hypothetical protein [Psychrosphaera algicola]|uniref:Uncharacterized protein n=1 Tax=Psychrosphaera algicola TaxID=3023714 RepID=A0ABT5FHY7_9GAMM|nr:hypothetical protein [Psychrosphaera sp. G1-22]MDC2890813.1 hypothetical protein [Psychrosphaera sp. G1-22]
MKYSDLFSEFLVDPVKYGHERDSVIICKNKNIFLFISSDCKTRIITIKIGKGCQVKGYSGLLEVPLLYGDALEELRNQLSMNEFVELRTLASQLMSAHDLDMLLERSLKLVLLNMDKLEHLFLTTLKLYRGQLQPFE